MALPYRTIDATQMDEALLFTGMAVLTALAVLAVIVPLLRAPVPLAAGRDDASVYRDQLKQLDQDRSRGLVPDDEGVAARAEIGRRLIAASERAGQAPAAALRDRSNLARVLMVALPVTAMAVYLTIGSPSQPAQPLAARLSAPPDANDPQALIARAEAELRRNPDRAEGWQLMAPIYLRLGRFEDAANAYANLIRLGGATAERETMRGIALMSAATAGAPLTEARAAFDRALALDPKNAQARLSRALAMEQNGEAPAAVTELRALKSDLPTGSPLVAPLDREIARIESIGLAGPTGEQMQAAASLDTAQQQEMARGMVERLGARLASDGGSVEEWLRLVRARSVLGDNAGARTAADDARKAYAGNAEALARIDELANSLGIASRS